MIGQGDDNEDGEAKRLAMIAALTHDMETLGGNNVDGSLGLPDEWDQLLRDINR